MLPDHDGYSHKINNQILFFPKSARPVDSFIVI